MSSLSSAVGDQLKLQLPSWVNMMQLIGFSKDFFELVRDIGEAKSKEVFSSNHYNNKGLTHYRKKNES